MSVFLFIIVIVGLVTCGEVVTKFLEQGRARARPAIDPGGDAALAELREQVSLLSDQVDRLTEEQRFLTRLLESAPAGIRLPPGTAGGGGGADPEPTTEGTG